MERGPTVTLSSASQEEFRYGQDVTRWDIASEPRHNADDHGSVPGDHKHAARRRTVDPRNGPQFLLEAFDLFLFQLVGRTGFEPVTSSVSGNSGDVPCVRHRRAESNWEPVTWEKNLAGSCYVRGRLKMLAPISGSHAPMPGAAIGTS